KTRTRDLAASIANGGNPGINIPVSFTPRNPVLSGSTSTDSSTTSTSTSAASSAISLARIGRISTNDFSLTLPGAIFKAMLTEREGRVLQSPQVRAVEMQKASLRLGDKIPFASGSFQPGFGSVGTGISPLVSTQFQFAEVGVNVDITPKVHGPEEVSLHVELELSTVRERIDIGGLQQPVIGQRKIIHDIRMREGEVNLLGGLQGLTESLNVNTIPGVGQVPILKYLFGSQSKERIETELVIALVPHIVRSPEITPANLRGISAGNDATVKLTYAPREEKNKPQAPAATPPAAAPAPNPALPQPPPAQPAEAAKPPLATASPVTFTFQPSGLKAALGAPMFLVLQMNQGADVFAAPFRVQYDPKMLRLVEVIKGNALSPDAKQINFVPTIQQDKGEARVEISRLPGSGGVTTSGPLVLFKFEGLVKGTTNVMLPELRLMDSKNQPIPVTIPSVAVTVE
ncbi:MAG: hypothetical protein JNK48_20410, partial [Bryobacterales bacterium]|nr:hypothetical protein [Bryobacterales bacterium]